MADEWTIDDNGGPFVVLGEDNLQNDLVWVEKETPTIYAGEVTTEITARDGDTLGAGEVTLKRIESSHEFNRTICKQESK